MLWVTRASSVVQSEDRIERTEMETKVGMFDMFLSSVLEVEFALPKSQNLALLLLRALQWREACGPLAVCVTRPPGPGLCQRDLCRA